MRKKNIALLSPNKNAYSETFIQNHKNFLEGNILYYYDGHLPKQLEGEGELKAPLIATLNYALKELVKRFTPSNYLPYKALLNSFKKNKIDVVFAEYGLTGAEVVNVCKELNIPLIVNFHGYDISVKEVVENYKELYLEMFEYATSIIAVSKQMKECLLNIGCPEEKITYITYGPSDSFFDIEPTYSEKSFIAVGRFTDKKAPYYTILSFSEVVKKYPDVLLYIAGEGDLLPICKNIVKHLGLKKNIKFLGTCTHEELLSYYSKVKAFVQHSITAPNGDSEGTPVAILEASAAALPIISTKHAGIPDVIVDNETGFLVDEHDSHAMAEKMIYLIENPKEGIEMGEAGRKNIYENYRMELHLEKLNSLIKSC